MQESSEVAFLKKLGVKIKTIRRERRFSLAALADNYGFDKASLSRLEAGKSKCTVKTLFRLADALEIPVDQFFTPDMSKDQGSLMQEVFITKGVTRLKSCGLN